MALTVTEAGILCLVLFVLFHWLGILAKTRAVLALLAAVAIGGGFIGRLIHDLGAWAQRATGAVTAWAFGTALSAVLFVVLAVILVHDLHPRKGASNRTAYVALGVGVLLAAGVAQIPALAPVAGGLRGLLASLTSFVNTL